MLAAAELECRLLAGARAVVEASATATPPRPEAVVRAADRAMYLGKNSGRGRYVVVGYSAD